MYTYIKSKLNDAFFHSRMFFGIKLFSIRKTRGYYSNIKNILEGLKEDGYYKLENFYSQNQIDQLNKCSYGDVTPDLSSARIQSPIQPPEEIGHERRYSQEADHCSLQEADTGPTEGPVPSPRVLRG